MSLGHIEIPMVNYESSTTIFQNHQQTPEKRRSLTFNLDMKKVQEASAAEAATAINNGSGNSIYGSQVSPDRFLSQMTSRKHSGILEVFAASGKDQHADFENDNLLEDDEDYDDETRQKIYDSEIACEFQGSFGNRLQTMKKLSRLNKIGFEGDKWHLVLNLIDQNRVIWLACIDNIMPGKTTLRFTLVRQKEAKVGNPTFFYAKAKVEVKSVGLSRSVDLEVEPKSYLEEFSPPLRGTLVWKGRELTLSKAVGSVKVDISGYAFQDDRLLFTIAPSGMKSSEYGYEMNCAFSDDQGREE